MWPWGHLAVGYLLYVLSTRARGIRPVCGTAVVALAVGTQFPDLIDKPLAYSVGAIPEGRALAHSLLFALPICVGCLYATRRMRHRDAGPAFALGYLSHLVADAWWPVLDGQFGEQTYLLWPILAPPDYETGSFGQHWEELRTTLETASAGGAAAALGEPMVLELALAAVVAALWLADGAPGASVLESLARRRR